MHLTTWTLSRLYFPKLIVKILPIPHTLPKCDPATPHPETESDFPALESELALATGLKPMKYNRSEVKRLLRGKVSRSLAASTLASWDDCSPDTPS